MKTKSLVFAFWGLMFIMPIVCYGQSYAISANYQNLNSDITYVNVAHVAYSVLFGGEVYETTYDSGTISVAPGQRRSFLSTDNTIVSTEYVLLDVRFTEDNVDYTVRFDSRETGIYNGLVMRKPYGNGKWVVGTYTKSIVSGKQVHNIALKNE